MKRVLVVCTGNTCRSPMAEGLLRKLMQHRPDVEVLSAGVAAYEGQPPSGNAVRALNEIGIDIHSHRSRLLTPELVRNADYILVMTYPHMDAVLMNYPSSADRLYLVRQFEPNLEASQREISDPIGGSLEMYRSCRDQLQRALEAFRSAFEHEETRPIAERPVRERIIVGSDQLYHELDAFLVEQGYEPLHFIPHSDDPLDYHEVVENVVREVLSSGNQKGLIVTSSKHHRQFGACSAEAFQTSALAALFQLYPDLNIKFFESSLVALEECQAERPAVICVPHDISMSDIFQILGVWLQLPNFISQSTSTSQLPQQPMNTLNMQNTPSILMPTLAQTDPEIYQSIQSERRRQERNIELIASENFTSRAVMEAQGSCLTNKYAEGYPGKRWYGGCEYVDQVEELAIERGKKLFGAEHINVQPHSGSQANMAVYFSVLKPADRILTMDLSHGGHLTHGHKMNFSGIFFEVMHYGVEPGSEVINYDKLAQMAETFRPHMITAGASAYSRIIDFARMGEIAKSVGAYLFIDMAHIAGLVAAGLHPSPIEHADFITSTTHKTLRGPRGGIILCKEKYAKQIDAQVFPGVQGGPLMHVIAAKAVCFGEALQPEFKEYQKQVVRNAKALCEGMKKQGYRIVSGTTENHLMLVDLQPQHLTGKDAQEALDAAAITVNKNAIPFDKQSPFKAGGIRLGTPAVTTRGMRENEMLEIADWIHTAISNRDKASKLASIREEVHRFSARFPLPY